MNSVKCWNCGLVNFAGTESCRRCKNELDNGATGQSGYGYSPQANQAAMPSPYQAPVNPEPHNSTSSYTSPYGGAPTQTSYPSPYSGGGTVFSENAAYIPASPYAAYANPAKPKQGLAIASLVIGIVGLAICLLGLLGSIPGLICGIKAVKQANRNPMEYGGKGMAIAGIVINSLLLLGIPIVAAIAIPNLLAARKAANEAAAIGTIRTISSAEATYQATNGNGSFGTLEELANQSLIEQGLSTKFGYKFKVVLSNCTSGSGKNCVARYVVLATPVKYGATGTGTRSFYVDESGVIRADDKVGMDADRTSPPLPTMPARTPGRNPYDY